MTPPETSEYSPPLILDEYVKLMVSHFKGERIDDDTVATLVAEARLDKTERDAVVEGGPDVMFSGFMWEPEHVTEEISDACLVALAAGGVLRARHQLLYWAPMLEMGLQGRFKGHVAPLQETREMLWAVAGQLAERSALTETHERIESRLADAASEVYRWLPDADVDELYERFPSLKPEPSEPPEPPEPSEPPEQEPTPEAADEKEEPEAADEKEEPEAADEKEEPEAATPEAEKKDGPPAKPAPAAQPEGNPLRTAQIVAGLIIAAAILGLLLWKFL